MKRKIKVGTNGWWLVNETDCITYEIEGFDFKEFEKIFDYSFYGDEEYDSEWVGNNPFSKCSKYQYAIEGLESHIEIQVNDGKIDLYKVLNLNDLEISNQVLIELYELEKLFMVLKERVKEAVEIIKKNRKGE